MTTRMLLSNLVTETGALGTAQMIGRLGGNAVDVLDIDAQLTNGYLNTDGTIKGAGAVTQERTTPFLDVEGCTLVHVIWAIPADQAANNWVAYALFDSSMAIVGSRINPVTATIGTLSGEDYAVYVLGVGIPEGVKYLRFSLRTYSDAILRIYSHSQDAQAAREEDLLRHGYLTNPPAQAVDSAVFWRRMLPLINGGSGTVVKFRHDYKRLSVADPIWLRSPCVCNVADGYRAAILNMNEDLSKISDSGWKTGTITIPDRKLCTLTISKTDNSVLEWEDIFGISFGAGSEAAFRAERAAVIAASDKIGIAHRGGGIGPENTLTNLEIAHRNGFRGAETDIALTADGVAVCLHDSTINRTARNADGSSLSASTNIGTITYEELLALDFGIYKDSAYAGTRIPTFAQWVQAVKEYGMIGYAEIKAFGYSAAQIAAMVRTVTEAGMGDRIWWLCFDASYLEAVRAANPAAKLELLLDGDDTAEQVLATLQGLRNGQNEVALGADHQELTPALLNACQAQGFPVDVWTVDAILDLEALPEGVRNVTTNAWYGLEALREWQRTGKIGELII